MKKQFMVKVLSTGKEPLQDKFNEESLEKVVERTQLPIPLTFSFAHRVGVITQLTAWGDSIIAGGTFDTLWSESALRNLTGVYHSTMENLEGFGPVARMQDNDEITVCEISLVPIGQPVPRNWTA